MSPRRVKIKQPPLRLIGDEDLIGADFPPAPQVNTSDGAPPHTLLRLGQSDLGHAIAALGHLSAPSAIVTSIAEYPKTRRQARIASNALGIPWLVDPVTARLAVDGYRPAAHLAELDYMPSRDSEPYQVADFYGSFSAIFARRVVAAQFSHGAGGAFAPSFCFKRVGDGWWNANQELWSRAVAARDGFGGAPLVLPVMCSLAAIRDEASQLMIARRVTQVGADAVVLLIDGLSEDSGVDALIAALRLVAMIRAGGVTVGLGRSGNLRRLFDCADGGLREGGLGRLVRFQLGDQKGKGGPGIQPARFELPSLLTALPHAVSFKLMKAGKVDEAECDCRACTGGASDAERTVGHNAGVVLGEPANLGGQAVSERLRRLREQILNARWRWEALQANGLAGTKDAVFLHRWGRVIDNVLDASMLERDQLARRLNSG